MNSGVPRSGDGLAAEDALQAHSLPLDRRGRRRTCADERHVVEGLAVRVAEHVGAEAQLHGSVLLVRDPAEEAKFTFLCNWKNWAN